MKRLLGVFLVIAIMLLSASCENTPPEPIPMGNGAYWTDEAVMVIQTEEELDAETLHAHLKNSGILLTHTPALAEKIQDLLTTKTKTSIDGDELAILFYQTRDGVSAVYMLEGNTTDVDAEIDDIIQTIKTERQ